MPKAEKWLGLMAMCFFALLGLWQFVSPDRDMSQLENRYLQKRPAFSSARVLSGRWGSEVESWLVDQVPGREAWVGINSGFTHYVLRQSEINGVYIAGEELYTKTEEPGSALARNISALQRLQERAGIPLTVLAVPTATTIHADRLPPYADYYDEALTIAQLEEALGPQTVLDISQALSRLAQEQKLYFRTDHHWTMEGAFAAYQELLQRAGLAPFARETFESVIVTDSFYGTTYAKVGLWRLPPEEIVLLVPGGGYDAQLSVGEESGLPLFAEDKLEEYDKYAYFLGGNQPVHIIKTGLQTGRRLMVVKDSYAHILAPLLSLHYDQIVLMDPRYVNVNPYELIQSYEPTELLVLMNADNMGQENGLSLFLRY